MNGNENDEGIDNDNRNDIDNTYDISDTNLNVNLNLNSSNTIQSIPNNTNNNNLPISDSNIALSDKDTKDTSIDNSQRNI